MGGDDDSEDSEIEACSQKPESCGESVETQLVESRVERSGHKRENSLIFKNLFKSIQFI